MPLEHLLDSSYRGMMEHVNDDSNDQSEDKNPGSHPKPKRTIGGLVTTGKYKLLASFYNLVHTEPEPVKLGTSPILLLGRKYHCTESMANNTHQTPEHIQNFLSDFGSLFWFCYRKDFPVLSPTHLTTDLGWGCMLRTGQMMAAQVMVRHTLGREWRLTEQEKSSPYSLYRQILRWFSDSPSASAPYSIHNIVSKSKSIETELSKNSKKAGDWFTPTRVSQILKALVRTHSPDALTMYVGKDAVLYKDQIVALCTATELYTSHSPPKRSPLDKSLDSCYWRPIFIVIPVRLGISNLNPIYLEMLKSVLQMPQSVGFIGGRPRQSLYFVGYQGDDVIYLDPHVLRSAQTEDSHLDTYHCWSPQKMPLLNVDPSLALGFYCANRDEFDKLCSNIAAINAHNPIFSIEDNTPDYLFDDFERDMVFI
eukprot:TRINITY_DN17415_c0_g1_i1.p1 TRINITY_DN17415_c0_g1~~TRINITY_DN17415_c0_g1_i1.p1  ORF type:complete len:423 (-),score=60.11 TRINITY_DN17415_c0_g1_i1:53-1321(-)